MSSIMVLDDDPRIRSLISMVLKDTGKQVRSVAGGEEGLKQLEDGYSPDVIVLDLMMPGIDGPTFYERARDAGYSGPVVVLSASTQGAAICKRLGVDAYLSKPFDPDELVERVDDLIHDPRRREHLNN